MRSDFSSENPPRRTHFSRGFPGAHSPPACLPRCTRASCNSLGCIRTRARPEQRGLSRPGCWKEVRSYSGVKVLPAGGVPAPRPAHWQADLCGRRHREVEGFRTCLFPQTSRGTADEQGLALWVGRFLALEHICGGQVLKKTGAASVPNGSHRQEESPRRQHMEAASVLRVTWPK